jgi:hypothetical protein
VLRFLSSLFNDAEERSASFDEVLLNKAIERVVDGTDRRLRALGDYRKPLREPVEEAIRHVVTMVDSLPSPVAINARAFGADPTLRALFVSADHLREVCRGFNSVREFLASREGSAPEEIFGLLVTVREERKVFGMALEGDNLKRDVLQVAVNFSSHRYLGPADNEADTRWELKKRAFDFLVEGALERLMEERGKRLELDRQRSLLQRKLEAMRAGNWGLAAMLDGEGISADIAGLEADIEAIEAELKESHSDNLSLQQSLDCVVETLGRPADYLASRQISLHLDYRGIKLPDSSSATGVELTELFTGSGHSRTALLGRITWADIPEAGDFWDKAKRYL